MKVNDIVNVKIDKLVFGGESIGLIDNKVVFVPMGLPGDELEVKIISNKKDYSRGTIQNIIKASKDRIHINLKTFEDFSGCDFANMIYEKQIYYKKEILKDVFEKISKIQLEEIPFVKSDKILNYRNKVAEPFVKIKGEIKTGFYKKKSHEIFVADNINLRSEISTEILNNLLKKFNKFIGTKREFKVYNDISKTGFLKNCVIRNNEKNEVMLIIVVNNKSNISRLDKLLKEFYLENENLKSVYISVKEKQDNIIFGETFYLVSGEKYLTEEIFGIKFKIYPDSFFQINKLQAEKIYSKVLNLLANKKDLNIIDAFSGTGTISMILSKKAKKVYGIEMVQSSIKAAIKTSLENNIKNCEFINSKVEDSISDILKKDKIDYIIFDPPRKGIHEKVLKEVIKNKIEKIIYISCNPSTLARDIKILKENGYNLEFVEGYDMFPQTHHIETIALISKSF